MNPEVKQKWVKALRSGQYKKGTGSLRTGSIHQDGEYCCLGVLCDIYAKEQTIGWNYNSILNSTEYLPSKVAEWAWLDSYDPTIKVSIPENQEEAIFSLSSINDLHDYNFNKIADLIEQKL
jgi:hypothetical protein